MREAFAAWSAASGVEFVEVEDAPDVDIRLGWQQDSESDGRGGTAAQAQTLHVGTETVGVAIVFDRIDYATSWTTGFSIVNGVFQQIDEYSGFNEETFYDAVLHEIGHAVGIDHSDVPDSVLSGPPTTPYVDQEGRDQLTPDDVAAAQAIWGEPYQTDNGHDSVVGYHLAERIHGQAGNDTIFGEGGAWS